MVKRTYWIHAIEAAWRRRSVVWLTGVRRSGKTVLCQGLDDTEYFDCELPRTRRLMEDPEGFLSALKRKRVALDEIHRLPNPSELLKIAADHFPRVRVVATGSSTLEATAKFRDSLTGRKADVWLTPMMSLDLEEFGGHSLPHRLLRGGLPPFFLSPESPDRDYQDWIDSYWARDIQEIFRLERRAAFVRFLELLLARSGGIFEATAFATPCEVSRTTIANYLEALVATRVVHVVRPYSGRRSTEIIAAPKVFGFDTGFVCAFRGWHDLREEDLGVLWEHYVLNELHARTSGIGIHYWRNKAGHEVDFVLVRRGEAPIAVECKWRAKSFEPESLRAFRKIHAKGENWVVAADVDRAYRETKAGVVVEWIGLEDLVKRVMSPRSKRTS